MSVFKDPRNNLWMVKFRYQGQQVLKRGFQRKNDAQAWEAQEKQRLKEPAKTNSISFGSLATKYLEHCKARFQQNTWRSKAFYFAHFLGKTGEDVPVTAISRSQANDYLLEVSRERGNKLANRHLKDLHALFVWGVTQELAPSNPFHGIPKFPEEPFVKYVPPTKDIDAVILAASPEETDLLEVLYHTGARISEVMNLKWEDIKFERQEITLFTRKRRGGALEADKLAMGHSLLSLLKRKWNARTGEDPLVFTMGQYRKRYMLERLCERAGVKKFGFHAI